MHQKTQNHCLKFSVHLSVRKSRENYRQINGKSKSNLWRNLSTGTPPKLFRTILCFVALVYNSYFFRTAVLWKLFDIRFSYKHCNFSHVCLLVKMASKTVTRSLNVQRSYQKFARTCILRCTQYVFTTFFSDSKPRIYRPLIKYQDYFPEQMWFSMLRGVWLSEQHYQPWCPRLPRYGR